MAKPKTVRDARQRAGELRQRLNVLKQSLVEKVENESMRVMEVSESRYYGIIGYPAHLQLRQAIVLMLLRHPHLRLPKEWVADYLNVSVPLVEGYEEVAVKTLAGGSASAFGRELEFICACVEVVPNQILNVSP